MRLFSNLKWQNAHFNIHTNVKHIIYIPYCTKLLISRNFTTKCTMEVVAELMDMQFADAYDWTKWLSPKDMHDLTEKLLDGKYKFPSPRLIRADELNANKSPDDFHRTTFPARLMVNGRTLDYDLYCLILEPQDELIALALANSIMIAIRERYPLSINSLIDGDINGAKRFYDRVCSWENVDTLFRVDLSNSLFTANHDMLIEVLSTITNDLIVIDLVNQFLNLEVDYSNMKMGTLKSEYSIPPVSLLQYALLELAFIKLDLEMLQTSCVYRYNRYCIEAYFSYYNNNHSSSSSPQHIEDFIHSMFAKYSLNGVIQRINFGDDPVKCMWGNIGLCPKHKTVEFQLDSEYFPNDNGGGVQS